jgi:hypothetical protein
MFLWNFKRAWSLSESSYVGGAGYSGAASASSEAGLSAAAVAALRAPEDLVGRARAKYLAGTDADVFIRVAARWRAQETMVGGDGEWTRWPEEVMTKRVNPGL